MVMDNCPEGLFIFIAPESLAVLSNRLKGRGTETKEQLDIRTQKAKWEIKQCKKFEFVVVNDELETAVNDVREIISSFRKKVMLNTEFIDGLLNE